MTQTNDIELAHWAQKIQIQARSINEVMAAGRINAVIDLHAEMSKSLREWGWRAQKLYFDHNKLKVLP